MNFVNLDMSNLALFLNFLVYMSKLNNINAKKNTNYFLLFVKGVFFFLIF